MTITMSSISMISRIYYLAPFFLSLFGTCSGFSDLTSVTTAASLSTPQAEQHCGRNCFRSTNDTMSWPTSWRHIMDVTAASWKPIWSFLLTSHMLFVIIWPTVTNNSEQNIANSHAGTFTRLHCTQAMQLAEQHNRTGTYGCTSLTSNTRLLVTLLFKS